MVAANANRISWLDVMKGLAILLVILQHCLPVPAGSFSKFILAFHMPAFFFASGMVKKNDETVEHLANSKISGLLLPMICVAIINMFIEILLTALGFSNGAHALLLRGGWFVEVLLWIIGISFIADKLMGRWGGTVLALFIFFELIISPLVLSDINVLRHQIAAGMLFYLLGYAGKRLCNIDYRSLGFKLLMLLLAIISFVLLFVNAQWNTAVYMNEGELGFMPLFAGNALVGIVGIICLSKFISSNRILEFYGRSSLIILFTHPPIMALLSHYLYIYKKIAQTYTLSLLIFAIISLLEIAVVPIFNKYFPWITGKYRFR